MMNEFIKLPRGAENSTKAERGITPTMVPLESRKVTVLRGSWTAESLMVTFAIFCALQENLHIPHITNKLVGGAIEKIMVWLAVPPRLVTINPLLTVLGVFTGKILPTVSERQSSDLMTSTVYGSEDCPVPYNANALKVWRAMFNCDNSSSHPPEALTGGVPLGMLLSNT